MSAIVGMDQCHKFTITAGNSPSGTNSIVLTFADGAWGAAPVLIAQMIGGNGQISDIASSTATTYTLNHTGTAIEGETYTFVVFIQGN
jgi:hypothetical protein